MPLSISMIGRDAIRVLSTLRRKQSQFSVEVVVPDNALELPLDDFSEQYVIPAMKKLADRIPHGHITFLDLELSEGFEAITRDRYDAISMRGVQARVMNQTMNGQGSIEETPTDKIVIRFDVLIEEHF